VLNATPDSFSDGGRFVRGTSDLDLARGVDLAAELLRDGR
jgi:dihydropteroate synthase